MKVGTDYIGIGCGALIINDKNEVLLLKRAMTTRTEPGTRSRPGGQVEFGETIEEAVVREVEEETGINVKVLELLEVTQNIDKDKPAHWIAFGYLAQYISGEIINTESDKHDEIKRISLDSLPENINNYTLHAIQKYLEKNK